jgi:predicted RNase H-like HicB family nuclease
MAKYYPAILERSSDGYGVYFPDLPGCVSVGDTVQEALRNAEEALQAHFDLTIEHGESLADPSDIGTLPAADPSNEAGRFLVRVELPAKVVDVNVPVPQELLAAADRYAAQTGFTREGLIVAAMRDMLRADRAAGTAVGP